MTEHKFTDEEIAAHLSAYAERVCSKCKGSTSKFCSSCVIPLLKEFIHSFERQKKALQNAKADTIEEYLAKVLGKKDIAGHYVPDYDVVSVSVLEYYAKEFMEGEKDEQTEN